MGRAGASERELRDFGQLGTWIGTWINNPTPSSLAATLTNSTTVRVQLMCTKVLAVHLPPSPTDPPDRSDALYGTQLSKDDAYAKSAVTYERIAIHLFCIFAVAAGEDWTRQRVRSATNPPC